MLNTKLYIDESTISDYTGTRFMRGYSFRTKIKCDNPDIPIISYENAIVYLHEDDIYTKCFKLPTLRQGLLRYKGNYFYFDHNIVETPKTHLSNPNSVHSYDIYQITTDLAKKIIENRVAKKCEILFNSFFYFGRKYISIRRGDFVESYINTSYKNEDGLFLPYGISPSDLKDIQGITIKDYLDRHEKEYPNYGTKLDFSISVWRNYKLEEIFI